MKNPIIAAGAFIIQLSQGGRFFTGIDKVYACKSGREVEKQSKLIVWVDEPQDNLSGYIINRFEHY